MIRKVLIGVVLALSLAVPSAAVEISAPEVPRSGQERMPENTESFGDAFIEMIQKSNGLFQTELKNARYLCSEILFVTMFISILSIVAEKLSGTISIAGTVLISSMIFQDTNAMIICASDAVWEICEYGKLLCPVLTTALAAQGGITTSAMLYTGTTAFITFVSMIVSRLIVPMVYIFLSFSVAYSALGEEMMKKFADSVKSILSWLLKTVLIVFTTYLSITGVVSGTTDTAALKAAKVTISSVVPVVGGILSDASESVLTSIAIMKNAAGIYGMLAVLAVIVGPFIQVGVQFLMLKAVAIICGLFGNKNISSMVENYSAAMGLLLAMIATGGILVLISTVCYLKGMG